MTPRERLLAVLNHKIPDRVPWAPLVDGYFLLYNPQFIRESSEESWRYSFPDPVPFLRQIGADILARGMGSSLLIRSRNVRVTTKVEEEIISVNSQDWMEGLGDYLWRQEFRRPGGCTISKIFETPRGILSTKYVYEPDSGTVFQSEFPIKTVQDYKVFTYMLENLQYGADYGAMEKEIAYLGEEGLATEGGHGTPLAELIEIFMGLATFVYHYYDHPRELRELMETMFYRYQEAYHIVAHSPAQVIIAYEDAGTTLYSPQMFRELGLPVLRKYVEIAHSGGKILLIHACGHLRDLTEMLRETGADGIESATPSPTGNIGAAELKERLGPNRCVIGGIDPTALSQYSPPLFRDYIERLLKEARPGGNFILATGDATPADARLENLMMVSQLVAEYGVYQ